MKAGEFFLKIGIKGEQKVHDALVKSTKGVTELKSASLETKAALLALFYAVEQLIDRSGKLGTGLMNFSSFTGLSDQTLQKWEFAARHAGAAAGSLTSSIKNVQAAMTEALTSNNAPQGWTLVDQKVGLDKKRAQDTFYILGQLQKFAQSVPADIGNKALKSFGLSEDVIAVMRRNAFRPDVFKLAPTYSESEIQALHRANVAWGDLGNKIEMAFGRFNAKHGGQLVKDFTLITNAVIDLSNALEGLNQKFKILETIGEGLEGIANTIRLITEITKKIGGEESKPGDLLHTPGGKEIVPGLKDSPVGKFFRDLIGSSAPAPAPINPSSIPRPAGLDLKRSITPRLLAPPAGGNQKIDVHQNLNFHHDGKDAKKTGDSVKKAVDHAFRQMSAQTMVT